MVQDNDITKLEPKAEEKATKKINILFAKKGSSP